MLSHIRSVLNHVRRLMMPHVSCAVCVPALLVLTALPGCVTLESGAGLEDRPSFSTQSGLRPRHRGPIFTDWWFQSHVDHLDANNRRVLPTDPGQRASSYVPPFRYTSPYTYAPMPQPGGQHGIGFRGWMSWLRIESTRRVEESGAPVVLLFRERNSPYPFKAEGKKTEPGALRDALSELRRLDYLILDLEFEHEMIERNVREIVRAVRTHPNPAISSAWIGNYNDYPGSFNSAFIWDDQQDRTRVIYHGSREHWDRDTFYRRSGMNMAMPSVYPYEAYSQHANPRRARHAPSTRAAMLWAPVEHLSVAARNLSESDMLVPWISSYVRYKKRDPRNLYNAPAPPQEDLEALVRHIYLRGADGFVVWTSNDSNTEHPTIRYDAYRDMALNVWRSMDASMGQDLGNDREVLELDTDIKSGVIVSAATHDGTTLIYVSNLSGRDQDFRLEQYASSLRAPVRVADGEHRLIRIASPND